MTAVNYHSWSICSDACDFGKALKIPVYQFVKTALIRKFGKDWLMRLENMQKRPLDDFRLCLKGLTNDFYL